MQLVPGYTLHRATQAEAVPISQAIAASFHDLDSCLWLMPDPELRRAIFPAYLQMFVGHAVVFGHVDFVTTGDSGYSPAENQPGADGRPGGEIPGELVAAAVWLDAPYPPIPDYVDRLGRICGRWIGRFLQLDAAMSLAHPPTVRHAYLVYLAVLPGYQGRGLGTALLDLQAQDPASAGWPAYLEASNADSARLYGRHGFAAHGAPIRLPYEGEPIYPMWRSADAASGRDGRPAEAPSEAGTAALVSVPGESVVPLRPAGVARRRGGRQLGLQ